MINLKLFLEGGSYKSETLLTFLSSFIFDNWLVQKRDSLSQLRIIWSGWTPEDPSGEHGEGLLDRAHQDGGKPGIKAGPRLDEDVHHVRRDHVDPCPLGDHHQGPNP